MYRRMAGIVSSPLLRDFVKGISLTSMSGD